jgi:hypothetical protein
MSHRFPQLATQSELDHARRHRRTGAPVLVMTLAQLPSLPWFEMLLGAAFLMALQGL